MSTVVDLRQRLRGILADAIRAVGTTAGPGEPGRYIALVAAGTEGESVDCFDVVDTSNGLRWTWDSYPPGLFDDSWDARWPCARPGDVRRHLIERRAPAAVLALTGGAP